MEIKNIMAGVIVRSVQMHQGLGTSITTGLVLGAHKGLYRQPQSNASSRFTPRSPDRRTLFKCRSALICIARDTHRPHWVYKRDDVDELYQHLGGSASCGAAADRTARGFLEFLKIDLFRTRSSSYTPGRL